ncbi:MAG: extracellular solute-binding protein [Alphaproteobacteria bacterium]|nr:extracellular solute-binding protein [Alphaproteobacteria bacterium]
MIGITRRRTLVAAIATGMLASPRLRAQAPQRLRMTWWGGADRARRTNEAIAAYVKRNPALRIDTDSVGWNDYWTRLATQVAGGNAPDLIQMDYRYIFEYARRNALRPLDEFMPDPLAIGDFGAANLDSGRVDGKLYGVAMGLNSTAMFFDRTAIEGLGLAVPDHTTSWAQLAELAIAVTKKANRRGYWGVQDAGYVEPAFEVWLRQRGKRLYDDAGKLGFARDDVAEWFDFWDKLRKAGGSVIGEVQALDKGTPETSVMTTGRAAMTFSHSNLLVAWQGVNKNRLGMTPFPRGDRHGQYYKPSMQMSIAATAANPQEAAKVISFLATDPEAGNILQVERGVPPSARMRGAILGQLDDMAKAQVEFISLIADKVSPIPPPPPKGAGENEQLIRRVYEKISLGQSTVPAAATEFHTEAARVLERA